MALVGGEHCNCVPTIVARFLHVWLSNAFVDCWQIYRRAFVQPMEILIALEGDDRSEKLEQCLTLKSLRLT